MYRKKLTRVTTSPPLLIYQNNDVCTLLGVYTKLLVLALISCEVRDLQTGHRSLKTSHEGNS